MRKMIEMDNNSNAAYFDNLRKEYRLRREFNNYTVYIKREDKSLGEILRKFRIKVQVKD